ncbi:MULTISPECIES: PepSY domain-containing protein [unclassified Streptomyces]|uniref:PepSY domain-containing protein n=1 Tax=unclassified Streptomyces TaxID=2593676 RepID=UPI0021C72C57|nr:PepSY domain-containing protein [Streptomyces sp. FIT100]UUN27567.1 PepSY domain-containing protein [Streptomyces sp. FIT100]
MKRTFVIGTVAAAALVGGIGYASAAPAPVAAPNGVTAAEAAAAALKKVPGVVDSVDRADHSRGWEVDVLGKDNRWYDIVVRPDGTVRHVALDRDGDNGDRGALRSAKTTAGQAAAAALKAVPGKVTSIDFSEDDGRYRWDVEVRDAAGREHDLVVDARTHPAADARPVVAVADVDDHYDD